MTERPAGVPGRRPEVTRWVVLAGAALALSVLTAGATGAAAASKVTVASAVPMPRPNPLRLQTRGPVAINADAIGAIISGDDRSEATSSEDSDAPQATGTDASAPVRIPGGAGNVAGLKLALALLEKNDAAAAGLAAYGLPNRIDIKIVEWLIATGTYSGVTSATLASLSAKLADWPSQSLMRLRYEQTLAREKPAPDAVIKALGGRKPASDDATLMLARAYVAVGRKDDAGKLVRAFWRTGNFSEGIEKAVASEFGDYLTASDRKWRMDRLLYAEREAEALRAAAYMGKDTTTFAKAIIAVIRQKPKAPAGLDAVAASFRKDPLYTYARIQILRRAGKTTEAGNLLAAAPRDPALIVDPDAWWVERRLVSRALVDDGKAKLAYTVAAGHSNETAALRAEAEFHAGWYALEYLRDPKTAMKHFAEIEAISTMPLSLSRAEYWLGRAAVAAGNKNLAASHFQRAAAYPTTFYGQLAISRLGGSRLAISQPPAPTPALAKSFADRELVQAIRHLSAVGYDDRAATIYRHLAETLADPAEIALLAQMAEAEGKHQIALQIGKVAAGRGMPTQALAFPTAAIPASAKTPRVERPVVFAIARQESAFNPAAISSAGARGLLQLMPTTAKQVAKDNGMPYDKGRLTSDPGYNATLGAAHLGDLVDKFGGSYVMTFAAYNAGSSRVADWVRRYGDPRDPSVDVVNWIESIPFTETRNYVQRIIENLQVYRARLGQPALAIEADLRRGGSG
jgi:soluble lytic murein transglycosylase